MASSTLIIPQPQSGSGRSAREAVSRTASVSRFGPQSGCSAKISARQPAATGVESDVPFQKA